MQINQVNIVDICSKEGNVDAVGNFATTSVGKEQSEDKAVRTQDTGELRNVQVKNATYGKSLFDEDSTASELAGELAGSTDAQQRKNEMIVMSDTNTERDYQKIQEDGYDPMALDQKDYVNIADKIKMQLAKAGADVSVMGGLTQEEMASITGSEDQAIMMENALQKEDLPLEGDVITDAVTAYRKAEETGALTPAGMKYMLANQLEPTIDNLYKATYSEEKGAMYKNTTVNPMTESDLQQIEPQIRDIIQQAGLEDNEANMAAGKWMIQQDIPLTVENMQYYDQLAKYTGDLTSEEVVQQITTAIQEGKNPQNAYLIKGYSLYDQAEQIAKDVVAATQETVNAVIDQGKDVSVAIIQEELNKKSNTISTSTSVAAEETMQQGVPVAETTSKASSESVAAQGVSAHTDNAESLELTRLTAYRQLEEVRLLMTTQANYTLMKQGISIDTEPLQQLIEQLKALEASYQNRMPSNLLSAQNVDNSSNNVDNFLNVTSQVAELEDMPAAILGRIPNIAQATVAQLHAEGVITRNTYEKANETYEALMTAPRKDMGDSIQKAFQNVDDILKDMNLETNEANQRAVRILGYNNMEITQENIDQIKAADAQVQRLFKNMTPAVVTEMMKEDINPLDMNISELNTMAEEIQQETGSTASEERFSKYLWKLEQTEGITPKERASFIGVFRLIHQVEQTDGAAIGSLVQQGADVTMRNLMTAVRSSKHGNKEYGIDDSFGALESYDPEQLSITQQIEVAYQTDRLHDVRDKITPAKMMNYPNEDAYMNLTPEQLADQLQQMDDAATLQQEAQAEEAYQKQMSQQVSEAVQAEKTVYDMLEQYDLPTTPANLAAIQNLLSNRNGVFRQLMNPKGQSSNTDASDLSANDTSGIDLTAIMQDLIEDFGEAVKTPKEMAEAQQKLEEVAENAMKNLMVETDVRSIDVRGMKMVMTQIEALGQMAEKSECYTMPIMVADEVGNLSLKIVRGKEEKGLVDIAFDMESTGTVSASFRYEAGMVDGTINSDRQDTRELLAEHMGLLAQNMSEATGKGVSFSFGWKEDLNIDDFYQQKNVGFEITEEQDEIMTSTLYGVAKSFIDTLGEIG